MGADHRERVFRNLVYRFDKHGSTCPQAINDRAVMDDLMAHVDRLAHQRQQFLNDCYGAINASTKTARISEPQVHWPRSLETAIGNRYEVDAVSTNPYSHTGNHSTRRSSSRSV